MVVVAIPGMKGQGRTFYYAQYFRYYEHITEQRKGYNLVSQRDMYTDVLVMLSPQQAAYLRSTTLSKSSQALQH